jgi:hypothetical protein
VPLTDRHIERLPNAPSLKALVLADRGSTISDDSLERIAKYSDLETLQLVGNITDDGMSHLQSLRRLKRLSLAGLDIDGRGLKSLVALPELKELCLRSTRVSVVEAKKWLPKMQALRKIDLAYVPDRKAILEQVVETLPCLKEADLVPRFEGEGRTSGHAYVGE